MRVSVVQGKLMLLIGKDTLKVLEARFDLKNNIRIFQEAGDFEGKVLRESRAGHLFVPSETAAHLVFSTNVTNETFSVKRLPRSRIIRDLMITSGRGVISKTPSHFSTFASEKSRCG